MAVNWKDLKREIHDEVEKVWLKEPLEVTMSKLGVFPSGAGTDNQILGTLFFLNADTQAMGWWTIEPSMYCVLGDDKFSLDVCKQLFIYLNGPIAHLLGDVLEPNCPAPWLNMPKFAYFHDKIVESYPTIETKEEFRDLLFGSPTNSKLFTFKFFFISSSINCKFFWKLVIIIQFLISHSISQ